MIHYRTAKIDDCKLFYREAGDARAPVLLLLHGFPTSSHMFRDLIPRLADQWHVIAPDLPGFGFSDAPDRATFRYTFDNLAKLIDGFTQAIGVKRYAIFVFDYGAPVGFRLALAHPERVTAIISQNGNAYEEGLSEGWNPIQKYWKEPSEANRAALRAFLSAETTKWQYVHGVSDETLIAPESYTLDSALLARPGNDEIQLDLFGDYQSNIALYPKFQEYIRTRRPPLLAVWGKNDPSSCLPAPRLSNATIQTPKSICSKPVISHSKARGPRSPTSSAISLPASCRNRHAQPESPIHQ
jgi:pimeloyl-ACP methyl ester carboxylesterase